MINNRIRGRSTTPSLNGNGIDDNSIILDTAMGYGIDIAQAKYMHPGADVYGMDIGLGSNGDFTYQEAKKKVSNYFGEDVLSRCNVICGDARDLPFDSGKFSHVFSYGMIHHLKDEDRVKTFNEAYRVLKRDAFFQMICMSGDGLQPIVDMKDDFDWEMVREHVWENGERVVNPNLDYNARQKFLITLGNVCKKNNIHPLDDEWGRVEQVAGNPNSFHVGGLTIKYIHDTLSGLGFRTSFHTIEEGNIKKYIVGCGTKT